MNKIKNLLALTAFLSCLFTLNMATASEVDSKIVGGDDAIEGEHPWVAYLSFSSTGNSSFCGASLISERWVITAAHCIISNNFLVVAGVYDRNESSSTNTFRVQNIYVHPNYASSPTINDIALLQLHDAVPTSLVDEYAQLPSLNLDAAFVGTDDDVKVMGWGALTQGGDDSDILQEVVVPVTSENACTNAYGQLNYDQQVCAGLVIGGQDSCQGDSGGPLLFSNNGVDYVAGLVSYGNGCAQAGFPGVYTRTAGYLDWIDSIMGADGEPQNSIVRFQNYWKMSEFIHNEDGPVEAGIISYGWASATWNLVKEGNNYYIQNRWKPHLYLYYSSGQLRIGPAFQDKQAQWIFVKQDGQWEDNYLNQGLDLEDRVFLIRNAFDKDIYLSNEYGELEAIEIGDGWWSSRWVLGDVQY